MAEGIILTITVLTCKPFWLRVDCNHIDKLRVLFYKSCMSVVTTRREHLEDALEILGGINQLAEALGVSPQYIYSLTSGRRNVGHKTARKIENAVKWPEGYMDIPPIAVSSELQHLITTMPEGLVVEALQDVIGSLSDEGAALVASAILSRAASKK